MSTSLYPNSRVTYLHQSLKDNTVNGFTYLYVNMYKSLYITENQTKIKLYKLLQLTLLPINLHYYITLKLLKHNFK